MYVYNSVCPLVILPQTRNRHLALLGPKQIDVKDIQRYKNIKTFNIIINMDNKDWNKDLQYCQGLDL